MVLPVFNILDTVFYDVCVCLLLRCVNVHLQCNNEENAA